MIDNTQFYDEKLNINDILSIIYKLQQQNKKYKKYLEKMLGIESDIDRIGTEEQSFLQPKVEEHLLEKRAMDQNVIPKIVQPTIDYRMEEAFEDSRIRPSEIEKIIRVEPPGFGSIFRLGDAMRSLGYNYLGPNLVGGSTGTKTLEALKDSFKVEPVDRLDGFARLHDLTYSQTSDSDQRSAADRLLAEQASKLGTPMGILVKDAMLVQAAARDAWKNLPDMLLGHHKEVDEDGGWVRDLTQDGDVESHPGPKSSVSAISLVNKFLPDEEWLKYNDLNEPTWRTIGTRSVAVNSNNSDYATHEDTFVCLTANQGRWYAHNAAGWGWSTLDTYAQFWNWNRGGDAGSIPLHLTLLGQEVQMSYLNEVTTSQFAKLRYQGSLTDLTIATTFIENIMGRTAWDRTDASNVTLKTYSGSMVPFHVRASLTFQVNYDLVSIGNSAELIPAVGTQSFRTNNMLVTRNASEDAEFFDGRWPHSRDGGQDNGWKNRAWYITYELFNTWVQTGNIPNINNFPDISTVDQTTAIVFINNSHLTAAQLALLTLAHLEYPYRIPVGSAEATWFDGLQSASSEDAGGGFSPTANSARIEGPRAYGDESMNIVYVQTFSKGYGPDQLPGLQSNGNLQAVNLIRAIPGNGSDLDEEIEPYPDNLTWTVKDHDIVQEQICTICPSGIKAFKQYSMWMTAALFKGCPLALKTHNTTTERSGPIAIDRGGNTPPLFSTADIPATHTMPTVDIFGTLATDAHEGTDLSDTMYQFCERGWRERTLQALGWAREEGTNEEGKNPYGSRLDMFCWNRRNTVRWHDLAMVMFNFLYTDENVDFNYTEVAWSNPSQQNGRRAYGKKKYLSLRNSLDQMIDSIGATFCSGWSDKSSIPNTFNDFGMKFMVVHPLSMLAKHGTTASIDYRKETLMTRGVVPSIKESNNSYYSGHFVVEFGNEFTDISARVTTISAQPILTSGVDTVVYKEENSMTRLAVHWLGRPALVGELFALIFQASQSSKYLPVTTGDVIEFLPAVYNLRKAEIGDANSNRITFVRVQLMTIESRWNSWFQGYGPDLAPTIVPVGSDSQSDLTYQVVDQKDMWNLLTGLSDVGKTDGLSSKTTSSKATTSSLVDGGDEQLKV